MSRTEAERPADAGFAERLRSFAGKAVGSLEAPDPVNEPMIRHWCEATGDANPVYTDPKFAGWSVHNGIVAPPTMLMAWTMRGLRPPPAPAGNAQSELMALLDGAGFTSIVATNCEQEYERYLRPGDRVTATTVIESVSEEKKTGLGTGHFFATLTTYCDQAGEVVGRQLTRFLKFRPPDVAGAAGAAPSRPHPAINSDTEFFWDGVKRGELLIQRCASCGELRHPPRPMCGACGSFEWDAVRSNGRGEVYSFTVHHHPPVPGFEMPYAVALIELAEGTRLISNVVGVPAGEVVVGMPVQVEFLRVDDDLTVPVFRPTGGR